MLQLNIEKYTQEWFSRKKVGLKFDFVIATQKTLALKI